MHLLPFGSVTRCKQCGAARVEINHYCEGTCIADGYNGFFEARTLGEGPHPHLHYRCAVCGWKFLTETIGGR